MYNHQQITRPRLAAAWGAGGEYGIGVDMGVAAALIQSGVELSDIPHLGTSAGAFTAGMLATGVTIDRALDMQKLSVYSLVDKKPGFLRSLAHDLFGDTEVHNVRAAAIQLVGPVPFRRQILSSTEHPLSDIVAASGSVPGIFAPVKIAGQHYVDGSTPCLRSPDISVAHADKAASADTLLVTAPLAFPWCASRLGALSLLEPVDLTANIYKKLSGDYLTDRTKRETCQWEKSSAGRGKSIIIKPDEATARLIHTPANLFDRQIGLRAYNMTFESTMDQIENHKNSDLARLVGRLAVKNIQPKGKTCPSS